MNDGEETEGILYDTGDEVVTIYEILRQDYGGNGAHISAGIVGDHPVDTVYLQFGAKEEGEIEPLTVLLRPDEMVTIVWLCGGVLYSDLMGKLQETINP